ncbi:MAG: DegV family protein [Lachnospiraceae bacterium]|nr:DegV family protein [Lachnospiraceae bacterium]
MSIRIVTDTASDYTLEEAKKRNITLLPLTVSFEDDHYKDLYELDHNAFFTKLIETDIFPRTSLIPPYDYEEIFRKILDEGDDIICITLSSKLSGCYQSACIAAQIDPARIRVIDSLNATIGEKILCEIAADLIEKDKGMDEIEHELLEERGNVQIIALVNTLEYLKKGGRISSGAAIAGTVLSIKPVIKLKDGEIVSVGTARGSRNANNKLIELVRDAGGIDFNKPFYLAYSGLSREILDKYITDSSCLYSHIKAEDLPVSTIGSTIGTHLGPGAIGFAFCANNKPETQSN